MLSNLHSLLIQPIKKSISNGIKGTIGEIKLRLVIFFLLGSAYKVINNVTIQLSNNKTSQIDHILVSRHGVFVLETKNYKGDITINETTGSWTQSFRQSTYKFYSPIRQNEGHISSLKYLLKNKDYPYFNIICFVGTASFYQPNLPPEVSVGLVSAINLIKSHPKKVLTKETVNHIVKKIKKDKMPNNRRTKRIHLKNVRANRKRW